ncbi:endonuclease NucS domain-containing protein [Parasphingorhabdus sp. DH2-15]|uniref:endonuclease NucS domain-containing protein n=1 Tax=Parasphingorhabdus sp. DH2-15 TaxID=3444112 RepID=UPI003F68692C
MSEKQYYRVMAGAKSVYVEDFINGGYIAGGWGFDFDLSADLAQGFPDFSKKLKPIYLENHPDKSKVASGLACGMLWTICAGLKKGDVILTPDGQGQYHVGEISGGYFFVEGEELAHRRKVEWYDQTIDRSETSDALQNSAGSIGTVSNMAKHVEEIERLMGRRAAPSIIATDELIEDPSVFALEMHLEDFLVANWDQTELGRKYDIYEEEGEQIGKQFLCDTGRMDILAISKDRKELLVVELKKGRASDSVVGQVQRYMGYALDELAEPHQTVRGVIIALEDDVRLSRALRVTQNIDFYRYQVSFKLVQG